MHSSNGSGKSIIEVSLKQVMQDRRIETRVWVAVLMVMGVSMCVLCVGRRAKEEIMVVMMANIN